MIRDGSNIESGQETARYYFYFADCKTVGLTLLKMMLKQQNFDFGFAGDFFGCLKQILAGGGALCGGGSVQFSSVLRLIEVIVLWC